MRKAVAWVKARWTEFLKDVWDDASIGPVAGVLLSVLAGLIVWLTIEYAPGAAARADLPGEAEGGSIKPFWGRVTIVVMTLATLTAGFEPILTKNADRWWRRVGRRWWKALAAPIALILIPAKLASFAWGAGGGCGRGGGGWAAGAEYRVSGDRCRPRGDLGHRAALELDRERPRHIPDRTR